MAKYEIRWTQEQWFKAEVEATSEAEAEAKFWQGEYENKEMFGQEIQQSVDVLPGFSTKDEAEAEAIPEADQKGEK